MLVFLFLHSYISHIFLFTFQFLSLGCILHADASLRMLMPFFIVACSACDDTHTLDSLICELQEKYDDIIHFPGFLDSLVWLDFSFFFIFFRRFLFFAGAKKNYVHCFVYHFIFARWVSMSRYKFRWHRLLDYSKYRHQYEYSEIHNMLRFLMQICNQNHF